MAHKEGQIENANEGEIDEAFATLKERHIGAFIIAADIFFYSQMQ